MSLGLTEGPLHASFNLEHQCYAQKQSQSEYQTKSTFLYK